MADGGLHGPKRFLAHFAGVPRHVLCEMHYGQRAALERLWPETEVDPCEWHLRHVFERLLSDERRGNPQHADAIDGLAPRIELLAHNLAAQLLWERRPGRASAPAPRR